MTVLPGTKQVNGSAIREALANAAGAALCGAGAGAAAMSAFGLTSSASFLALAAASLGAGAATFAFTADETQRDELTGLPGRAAFRRELERRADDARQHGGALTVMNVNLRRVRDINEHCGHDVGDAMLLELREHIATLTPPGTFIARVGGDEFSAILTDVPVPERERIAGALSEAMARNRLSPDAPPLQVMVGVASCNCEDESPPCARELLRRADIALGQSKSLNAPVTVYTDKLSEELKGKKQLEDDLRHALANNGLHVNYQPLFAIDGVTLVGAETLVRWIHPKLGFISPLTFVGLAEERGLMDQLGEFVLRRACLDARDWPSHLFVAVNVSPLQFRKESFLDDVARILEETGLPAHRLELELTETAVVTDEAKAEEMIIELRARGVRMALDDFGTGYSSLIYLRRFAFDKIKIDRSFLETLEPSNESAIIVESMVYLGRSLGLTVTAEGIETVEQHRFLQGIGCHELQGFLFSRPLPLEAFSKLLRPKVVDEDLQRDVA